MQSDPSCQSCKFWFRAVETSSNNPCRRFPPKKGGFTTTNFEDYCGEHAPKIPAPARPITQKELYDGVYILAAAQRNEKIAEKIVKWFENVGLNSIRIPVAGQQDFSIREAILAALREEDSP